MGSGLAKSWAKNHKILLGSRDPNKGKAIAQTIGPNVSGGTVAEAAAFGETVVLATPWAATADALKAAGPLTGKVLIDCTNPLAPDGKSLVLGTVTSGAEVIAKLAPGAKVVKAFNHLFAQTIHTNPRFGTQNATMFYCGNDTAAKISVAALAKEMGFDPVDVGPLQSARYLEPLAQLCRQIAYGLAMGTDFAIKVVRR